MTLWCVFQEKFEKKEETTREEIDLSVNTNNEIENNDNIVVEVEEIRPNEITGDQTHQTDDDDNEVEIVSEEDENPENLNIEMVETNVVEPEKEIVPIILDENLVKNNVEIIIDIDDIKIKNYEQKVESSAIEIEEKVEITKVNINTETPKQAFKGTKKRNPKYWKFDPDDEPENVKPVVKERPKRNLKYWKFDPDEFPLEQPSKPAETPKRRNPKYWKIDPEEEKLFNLAEASKDEEKKSVPTKKKRNPKYWKFDPDEEETENIDGTNETKPTKSETTGETLEQGTTQVFKGTKKRNPKYWKFDPDEFVSEEKSKKEPVTKRKRNPKYWKFDPDEDFNEIKKPAEEIKTEKEVTKKSKYWKTDEPVEDEKVIVEKEEDEPEKNKYWKKEEVENITPKEVIKQVEPGTKKNKYWKTEETEKQKEPVKEEDKTKNKNYRKTGQQHVDSVQEKLIETQRSMYWKLDDEEKSLKSERKEEKAKITRG